jgi:hypothetical protein
LGVISQHPGANDIKLFRPKIVGNTPIGH